MSLARVDLNMCDLRKYNKADMQQAVRHLFSDIFIRSRLEALRLDIKDN